MLFKMCFASEALRKTSLNEGAGFISCHCFAAEMNKAADCCSSPELLLHPDLNVFCHFMLTIDPDSSPTENRMLMIFFSFTVRVAFL